MSYADSPSAKLVATNCACCARPLVNAPSVESGMGEHCRKKHGYAAPDVSEADWFAVERALAPHLAALALPEDWRTSSRRAANLLVHRIAVEQDGELAVACANAVRALGYHTLAGRVAERMARVHVWEEGTDLLIQAPKSDELRRLPRRRWDPSVRATRVPLVGTLARGVVFEVLKLAYPGQLVSGPKGLFVLPKKDALAG